MNKLGLTTMATVALCATAAFATDWTGAQDSRWSNDANWADNALPGETDNVSFADWRIRYSANKVTEVNLEGAEKTVANIYVGTASDFPITVTNGTLGFTKCEIANQGSACEFIVSNATLSAGKVTVGGNGWNGGGTGVVHQVEGSVVAEALILGYGENGSGCYVLEGGSAVFTNLSYGADIWTSKAGEGLFAWQMFDCASDSRYEGERAGVNDKGLVTHDRVWAKDAYFFYKANWNPEPMLHLCSKRMASTTNSVVDVVAFSNVGAVTLSVNGKPLATKSPDEVNAAIFRDVELLSGENRISVTAANLADSCVWKKE